MHSFNIEKQCNRCGKVLPITEFFKSAKSKDGYKTICKNCCKIYNDKYRLEHLEQHKEYMKKYNAEHAEESKQYYIKHRDIMIRQYKQYYDTHKKEMQDYRNKSKERVKKYNEMYHNTTIEKECANPNCKNKFKAKRSGTKYCSDACRRENYLRLSKETNQKRYGVDFYVLTDEYRNKSISVISNINLDFAKLLEIFNIDYNFEFVLQSYSYDFYLPDYNLLVEINPTFTHSAVENALGWPGKDKQYHYNKVKTANDNGYQCICIWDWDNKEDIVKAIKNNALQIQKHDIQKHWSICETTKHQLDNNFNEQEMVAEGWVPVYDDGQTLIY